MSKVPYKERFITAEKILKEHFPISHWKTPVEDWAVLLANRDKAWGQFTPFLKHEQKAKITKIKDKIKELAEANNTHRWLKSELRIVKDKLDQISSVQTLHGKQNTSDFEYKVQLVGLCHQIWTSQTGKDAPVTFQGETHPFSLFVADVIQRVFELDFSPKSAIEAYKNFK